MVKSGQVVRVKVTDVDIPRQRIGLSLRLNDDAQQDKRPERTSAPRRDERNRDDRNQDRRKQNRGKNSGRRDESRPTGSMADALRNAGFGR